MKIINVERGYDAGGIKGQPGDGYLNIQLTLEMEDGRVQYLWMSRSWDYETVIVSECQMFAIAMHMTHYDADFELENQYLEEHALWKIAYDPLEFPEEELRQSPYYQVICYGREVLNELAESV